MASFYSVYLAGAVLLIPIVTEVAWAQETAEPPLFAIAGSQLSPGFSENDLTPALVMKLEAWAITTLREKISTALAVTGQEPRQAEELTIAAHSMLLVVEGKRLAVIQMSVSDRIREVSVMGFRDGEFYRVGCVRESSHEISVFFGKCGKIVSETFGVSAH